MKDSLGNFVKLAQDSIKNNRFTLKIGKQKNPVLAKLGYPNGSIDVIIHKSNININDIYGEGQIISGGKYNDALFLINKSKEMLKLEHDAKMLNDTTNYKLLTIDGQQSYVMNSRNFATNKIRMTKNHLKTFYNDKDPYMRMFAIALSYDVSDNAIAILNDVEKSIGTQNTIREIRKYRAETDKAKQSVESYSKGKSIYDFAAFNLLGEKILLSDVCKKNKYTLLEFWASWCRPCISAMKKIKPIYDEYKGNGVEVFAFSIDEGRQGWVNAVNTLGTNWINVHLEGDAMNAVRNEYALTAIPKNYLLDENGIIIAVNISNIELENLLKNNIIKVQ